MALHYGYENKMKATEKVTLQYTLRFPKTILNAAAYSVRPSSLGYKYITANGLTSKSTITLLTHSFSTTTGNSMDGGNILYSFEFFNKNSNFSYFNIEELNIKPLKIPREGGRYILFVLNKTYSFSKILKTNDLSNFTMFSIT